MLSVALDLGDDFLFVIAHESEGGEAAVDAGLGQVLADLGHQHRGAEVDAREPRLSFSPGAKWANTSRRMG